MNLDLSTMRKKIKETLATPKGKGLAAGMLIILVLLMVLLVVTLAIPTAPEDTLLVDPAKVSPAPIPVSQSTETATSVETTQTTETTQTIEETDTIGSIADLDKYKDPFLPLVETTSTTGNDIIFSGETTQTQVALESESLELKAITIVNSVPQATVIYKNSEYLVSEGDQIGDSPYQVVDIGDGSVTLLYGDDRLTLQVGDEVVK